MGDHEQRLEEILAEWDLDKGYESANAGTVSLPSSDDTITISASLTSPYTYTSGINLGAFPNAVYTTTGANTAPWATYNPTTTSTKINLSGEDADIEINGVSLWKTMQEIANRLNIMQTNPELETQWAELRELGDQYRKLEQHILDKQATFDRIKAMPAPEIN
jgi:hypothetical protein